MVVQFNSAKQANTAKKDIKRKKIKIKKKTFKDHLHR